jgi:hypothetical protein
MAHPQHQAGYGGAHEILGIPNSAAAPQVTRNPCKYFPTSLI